MRRHRKITISGVATDEEIKQRYLVMSYYKLYRMFEFGIGHGWVAWCVKREPYEWTTA